MPDHGASSIQIWNRREGREETEQVYGDRFLRWAYGTAPGRKLTDRFLSRRLVSRIYGSYQSSSFSERKIEPFIRKFGIRMEEFEDASYKTFNEFFVRKFKPGARVFAADARVMPAFAEARYFAYEQVETGQEFPVKGGRLSVSELMGGEKFSGPFLGGPAFVARLCPTDYHRFHYPDAGRMIDQYGVQGRYHSVNPMALACRRDIFLTNERQISILETENFGKLAYIEVGALCVGLIVQTHSPEQSFVRGQEKGYFLFGASTVIVLGESGAWRPDADLLTMTARGIETLVHLGEPIASGS